MIAHYRALSLAMELGVNEYVARFLASKTAEVSSRRLLVIAIAAKSGSTADAWRAASLLEELPGDGLLAAGRRAQEGTRSFRKSSSRTSSSSRF